ncbi:MULTISPECIES: DUF3316 domain-containing protein [Psychromonas]|uniref:DUF3316 domain-containing protein n=1 Tax=Psychromonas TaxID=67572 RepID=UPI0004219087|nr:MULTISPECIES: DUF3316 domain-containing protein [Psychromonas]MBB1274857.1 DUF3316 domain-containing protein [Psychromonas sp. SR45-3]
MKNFTTLTAVAAALLVSSSVFAATQVVHSDKTFSTDAYTNKTAAYDAGFDYLDGLKKLPANELRHALTVISNSPAQDLTIDKSKVTIKEFAQTRDQVVYRAVVDVDYHYTTIKKQN